MNVHVELPLTEPVYSTYHYQGATTAIAINSPNIFNYHMNQVMNLTCNRKFLKGFTTPEISVVESSWWENPYIEKLWISSRFSKGYINPMIREALAKGYYVAFGNLDDYYIQGKSWYKERHFGHDGLLCGYDQEDKTYCIYAYDSKWRYQKFWTPQRSFNAGRKAKEQQGVFPMFCALKVKEDVVEFSPKKVYAKLKEYLDSDWEKYPAEGEGNVFGIVVHGYIAEYLARLYRGEIPYERMDRRVFRLIWEHKKSMQKRIALIEKSLGMNSTLSHKYERLVKEADTMRMLYASHHMRRKDSVLPVIRERLLSLMTEERELLQRLCMAMERRMENGSVDVHKK